MGNFNFSLLNSFHFIIFLIVYHSIVALKEKQKLLNSRYEREFEHQEIKILDQFHPPSKMLNQTLFFKTILNNNFEKSVIKMLIQYSHSLSIVWNMEKNS